MELANSGKRPSQYGLDEFLLDNAHDSIYNGVQLQSKESSVCGQFCLFYLYHRCRDMTMDIILKLFTRDRHTNDNIVENFAAIYLNNNNMFPY